MSCSAGTPNDQSPACGAAAERLDEASRRYVELVRPIDFRLATSEYERQAAYRLRYEAVCERGWGTPDQFPDGLEYEALDDRALHMIAWLNGQAIGNCRMVLPTDGAPLPLEEAFGIRVEPAGEVVQIDRICISSGVGEERRLLLPALMSATWLEVRRRGYCVCAGLNTASMLRVYRAHGLEHDVLGPAKSWWSEDRYPVRFSPLNVRDRFYRPVGM